MLLGWVRHPIREVVRHTIRNQKSEACHGPKWSIGPYFVMSSRFDPMAIVHRFRQVWPVSSQSEALHGRVWAVVSRKTPADWRLWQAGLPNAVGLRVFSREPFTEIWLPILISLLHARGVAHHPLLLAPLVACTLCPTGYFRHWCSG